MLFNLFKKKERHPSAIDTIWMKSEYKFRAIAEEISRNPETVFIYWFDDTADRLHASITSGPSAGNILSAREAMSAHLAGKKIILAEHYPLLQKEWDLFERLSLEQVHVWSALDEPLFTHFGGDRIIDLMQKLGMKEEEPVQHMMISKSIVNAQEKIAKKVTLEVQTRSQKEWMEKNLAGQNH